MTRWSGPAVTGTENDIDGRPINFDARYTVASMRGVAWWLHGWATEMTEGGWAVICNDPAHIYDYDENDEDGENDPETHDASCYVYDEPEEVPDRSRVRAVMVGDDREHIMGTDELTELPEDGYCLGCGQTDCYAERLRAS